MNTILAIVMTVCLALTGLAPAAAGEKPTITKPCSNCHDAAEGVVRGRLTNLSNKARTLQVSVGKAAWVFDFDDETAFVNVEGVKKLKKDKETAVSFTKKNGRLYAATISTKPVFEVAADQLVDTAFVKTLVEKGPAEGRYVLVDARPGPKYEEGHIRNAVSMPLFAFDKKKDTVLPKEKDMLVLFYCGGVT